MAENSSVQPEQSKDVEHANRSTECANSDATNECTNSNAINSEKGTDKPKLRCCSTVDKTAVKFGLRLSIVLTLSSLFVLVQNPEMENAYPQGTWVFVSALMVSWFPSMDVASVAHKTFQRILGTIIGAILGLACGFLSIPIKAYAFQALFIGFCIAIVTFLVSFASVQGVGLFQSYPYATLLCLLTFGIAILPFYTDSENEWRAGAFRIANVIVGCAIAALGALLLWPRSSASVLKDKVQDQMRLAGEASDAVLQFASETLSDRENTTSSLGILTESKVGVEDGDVNDAAYQKYNKAICEYKAAQSVFPLSSYDPYNLCRDNEAFEAYRKECALALSRCLRIQTTIVLMDAALRNDYVGGKCTNRQLDLFRDIGSLIKTMLTPPCNQGTNATAAEDLLDRLDEIREGVVHAESEQVTGEKKLIRESLSREDIKGILVSDKVMPLQSNDNCSLLFLQLVEHLVIRSLRLFFTWKRVEGAKGKAKSHLSWSIDEDNVD